MLGSIRTWQESWQNKLSDVNNYDVDIFNANLDDSKPLTLSRFGHSLCIFIAEVTKVNGDTCLSKTLYQLTFSIQRFLNRNGINWKLVDGLDFK